MSESFCLNSNGTFNSVFDSRSLFLWAVFVLHIILLSLSSPPVCICPVIPLRLPWPSACCQSSVSSNETRLPLPSISSSVLLLHITPLSRNRSVPLLASRIDRKLRSWHVVLRQIQDHYHRFQNLNVYTCEFVFLLHLKASDSLYSWLTGVLFFLLSLTDAFVNSQEWTLSRTVPELKVVSSKDFSKIYWNYLRLAS